MYGLMTLGEVLLLEAKYDDEIANSGQIRVRRGYGGMGTVGCTDLTASPNFVYGTVRTTPCTLALELNL